MLNDPEWMRVITSINKGFAGLPAYPDSYKACFNDATKFQDKTPLEYVKAPTLICHGKKDE